MTARPSFRAWLRQHRHADGAIGDLARDAIRDRDWPRGPGSLTRYEQHLAEASADPAALGALRAAWRRYIEETARSAPT